MTLPPLALSVRQPWAWAILHAGKDIENRSLGAIRSGRMEPGRIALHAAAGMTEEEYRWAVLKMQKTATQVPPPAALPRGAIIGSVEVVEIVTQSDSPWFGHSAGLRLADPEPCPPIPAKGALGYFRWTPDGDLAPAKPWMRRYDSAEGLFDTLPLAFRDAPRAPYAKPSPKRS